MMQRIFDVENEKDMQDLWSILPDDVVRIKRNTPESYYLIKYKNNPNVDILRYLSIDWHDKIEITRPVNYEDMIGCVGWFWDCYTETETLSVLKRVTDYTKHPVDQREIEWNYFTPAKKSELKFYEDKQDE